MSLSKRLIAFGLGLVFVLGFFEVAIRVVGYVGSHKADKQTSGSPQKQFEILCLGNSHTHGAGVADRTAYSYVLENFLKAEVPGFPVRVVNGGIVNANTSNLYDKLDSFYNDGKPDVVYVMAGEPNIWNKHGLSEHLARKNGTSSAFDLDKILSYSRLYRWLKILPNLYDQKAQANVVTGNIDYEAFKILSYLEQGTLTFRLTPKETRRIHEVILEFLKRHQNEDLKTRWLWYFILATVEPEADEAFAYMKKSVYERLGMPNYYAANMIKYWIPVEGDPKRMRKIIDLRKLVRGGQTEQEFLEDMDIFLLSRIPPITDQNIARMERVRKSSNIASILTNRMAHHYMRVNNPMQASVILRELLEANPFTDRESESFLLISELADDKKLYDKEVRAHAQATRDWYNQTYPGNENRFVELNDSQLGTWVMDDLDRIYNKILSHNSVPVLQTYHWLRNQPESELMNNAVRTVSKEKNLAFLDTNITYMKEIKATGDEQAFFTQVYGPNDCHPSERGHRVIARLIYDHMNEHDLLPKELRNLPAKKIYRFHWENP